MSPWFDIRSGVKQGCAMSSWLFILYLDSCFQGVKQSDMGEKVGDLNVVRMKKNVLSSFVHVERMSDERMAKKIYDGKVSGKKGRGALG